MTNKRRIYSSLLLLLILFVLVASFYFILHEADHDCTGEDCPVCALVAVCRNTLKTFFAAIVLAVASLAARRSGSTVFSSSSRENCGKTPVVLKVKLLN